MNQKPRLTYPTFYLGVEGRRFRFPAQWRILERSIRDRVGSRRGDAYGEGRGSEG
jgi:hypothetical protein